MKPKVLISTMGLRGSSIFPLLCSKGASLIATMPLMPRACHHPPGTGRTTATCDTQTNRLLLRLGFRPNRTSPKDHPRREMRLEHIAHLLASHCRDWTPALHGRKGQRTTNTLSLGKTDWTCAGADLSWLIKTWGLKMKLSVRHQKL